MFAIIISASSSEMFRSIECKEKHFIIMIILRLCYIYIFMRLRNYVLNIRRKIDFQILKYYILMSNLSNGIMASIMYVEIEKIELIFEGIYFV